jgi:hypothetical protein
MEHCALAPKGDLLLIGSQDTKHLVFDGEGRQLAAIDPVSEYPHCAWFSADGSLLAFNACHLYSGGSIGVELASLGSADAALGEEQPAARLLQEGARVYAAVARKDEMIVGDAYGYVRAFDRQGTQRWQHFLGSTINALDLSPDGTRLAITSCAGFLSVLELDAAEPDAFAIGTSRHRETRRWLFWKGEPPLRW